MSAATDDDQLLRDYLLGNLAPKDLEAVDKRLFSTDRIFLEHFCLVEDELVDDYLDGVLGRQDKERFERWFISTRGRRDKVEFASTLRAYIDAKGDAVAADRREKALPAPRRSVFSRRLSAPAWALVVAATLLLLLPVATWQIGALRSSQEDVSVSLSSGLVRDVGGAVQRVRIPAGCKLVRLRLERDGNDYAGYRATLYDAASGEMWSQDNLHAAVADGQTAVTLTLPADLLQSGDYFVRLRGGSAGHDFVVLNRYDFRVLRE